MLESFTDRMNRLAGKTSDVYVYDEMPERLKGNIAQLIHISNKFLQQTGYNKFYNRQIMNKSIYLYLQCFGEKKFSKNYSSSYSYEVQIDSFFFYEDPSFDKVMTFTEYYFIVFGSLFQAEIKNIKKYEQTIADLNYYFRLNNVGYQFENDKFIRIDSTYTHAEIAKPTISLTSNPLFANVNKSYMDAHEHYKTAKYKECVNDCCAAYESTLKIIIESKNWTTKNGKGLKNNSSIDDLVKICNHNNLFGNETINHVQYLKGLLTHSVNSIGNAKTRHGQGSKQVNTDQNLAQYALNLTGSNILFLINESGLK